MNVIRLRKLWEEHESPEEALEREKENEDSGDVDAGEVNKPKYWMLAVTDNLYNLVPNPGDYFAIYVVWLEETELKDPFGVLELQRDEDIDRVSADDAEQFMHPLWKMTEFNDEPIQVRKKGSVLKLNFWNINRIIHYAWNDMEQPDKQSKEMHFPKSFVRSMGRTEPRCYLVLPGEPDSVAIYSEDAYTYYLAAGHVKRTTECCINYETSEQSFQFFECGHAICSSCFSQLPVIRCPNCNEDKKENKEKPDATCPRVKFRSGPCPIDLCTNKEMKGVVLYPCACLVPCESLMAKVTSDPRQQEDLLQKFPRCPYDACKKKIEKFVKFYPCSLD